MTMIITSDLHLSDNPRDEYRFKVCKIIANYARKVDATDIFILGDITDSKDGHSASLTNRVVDVLHEMSDNRRIWIVAGNHDGIDQSTPFFKFLNHIGGLHFVTKIETLEFGNHIISLIPHGCWPLNLPDCDLILTHTTFRGARAGDFILEGTPVPRTAIPIVSGDIHVPQTLGPVTYVGAPTLIDFGDDYKPRILRLDDNLNFTSVSIRAPAKKLVQWDGSLPQNTTPGDIVKVRVELPEGCTPEDIAIYRQDIKTWAQEAGVTINAIEMNVPKGSLPTKTTAAPRSDQELVKSYAKAHSFDEQTIKVGLDIVAGVPNET